MMVDCVVGDSMEDMLEATAVVADQEEEEEVSCHADKDLTTTAEDVESQPS